MKRFSLNKKRVSKVLALALVAAMVVPGVPAQKLVAADDGDSVTLPDPIATVNFANASSYSMSDSVTGKQLSFTSATNKAIWNLVTSDGTKTNVTYESIDKVAQMVTGATDVYNPDSYVWKDIDVAPTVVKVENEDVSGSAVLNSLSLKDSVDVADTYPAQASNEYSKIQSQKRYSSAVEVENPFAGNTDLYDASRYTMDKIVETATEVERKEVEVTGSWQLPWAKYASRYTAPEAKTGVTISFWAQTPLGKEALADTNFFEFYNTDSLIYSPDDLGKAWVAYQIENTKDWGTDDPDSLFYKGEVVTGKIMLIGNHNDARSAFKTMTGQDAAQYNVEARWDLNRNYAADVSDCAFEVAYIKNAGPLAVFNPEALDAYAEAEAFYDTKTTNNVEEGTLFEVDMVVGTEVEAWKPAATGHHARLVYVLGEDEEGNEVLYGLGKSQAMPTDSSQLADSSWGKSNYVPYKIDEKSETGYGSGVRAKKGGVGSLYLNQKQTYYKREAQVYDGGNDYVGTFMEKGQEKKGQLQAANNAYINYENEISDTDWHYYTVTLTDEWMQVYIDGVACDIAAVDNNPWTGDKFNMTSGLYNPATGETHGTAYDNLRRLSSAQNGQRAQAFNQGSIYGFLFGDSIMKFVTDPNTKLYIGGKTQQTAENTLIANVAFYDVKMTAEQAAAAYDAACDDAIKGFEVVDPEPTPSGRLGNVTGDKNAAGEDIIDSKDALAILKYTLGLNPDPFDITLANVTGDKNAAGEDVIDSKDALEILKFTLGLIDKFSGEK